MFGFRLITLVLVLVWFIAFVILKATRSASQGAQLRMVTLLGILLTFSGFFVEYWVELDFLGYIDPTPELIRDIIPGEIVTSIVKWIGSEWIGSMLDIFDAFTSFTGLTIHLIPTLFGWTWFVTLMPLMPLGISLPVLIIGIKKTNPNFVKVGSAILLATSLISVLSLLFVLPHLDAVGAESSFQFSLLVTILGAKMGNGPWVCIIGMLLLAVGGIAELSEQYAQTESSSDYEPEEEFL